MKTESGRTRNCWQAVVLVAAVLGACGPVDQGAGEELATEEQAALAGVTLGLSTGTFYVTGQQPLSIYSEQVVSEFSGLGAKWMRIEADSAGVDGDTYRRIVQKAHAKGIKVLVVVPARYCGADTQTEIDAFTAAYVSHLQQLVSDVFVGPGVVDAFEIGSEPNVTEALCPDAVSRFRVAPNAFAYLQRAVWNWKTSNARPEKQVSGGVLNTYTTEPFWNTFMASAALTGFPGNRPFDYFGVHPYNSSKMDVNCINSGITTCFTGYKNALSSGLTAAATRVNTATGTTGSKVFVTEFGFQVVANDLSNPADPHNQCTGVDNCTLLNSVPSQTPNGIAYPPPYQQLAAAMNAAGDAFSASGVTPIAIWYGYRDEGNRGYGLRSVWDNTTHRYLVKAAGWNKFRTLAGGIGSTNPDASWNTGVYFTDLDFQSGDALRSTAAGEWAYGSYKVECAPAERIMGLSKSIANGWSAKSICYKDPLDSGRYMQPTPRFPACSVRNVLTGDDRGAAAGKIPTVSEDWDSGNWKAECAPTEYVAGVAQTPDHQFSHVLCCPATVSATSCIAVPFGGGDNRQATDSGNWDAAGYKGECGVGRYVAGVSRTPTVAGVGGQPSALLCCAQ
jgi:hypothetical protein